MLLFTAKLSKKRLLAGVLVAALLVGIIIYAAHRQDTECVDAFSPDINTKNIRSNEDRVAFLATLGWQVDPVIAQMQESVIPKEFSDTYVVYNELQKRQGCDLTDYAGSRVKRYTYRVLNGSGEEEVYADLLVCKDTVIGGDICTKGANGSMEPLVKAS